MNAAFMIVGVFMGLAIGVAIQTDRQAPDRKKAYKKGVSDGRAEMFRQNAVLEQRVRELEGANAYFRAKNRSYHNGEIRQVYSND